MPVYLDELEFFTDLREMAREQGLEQGREQGREQGEALMLARVLQKRLPGFSDAETAQISGLSRSALDRLADAVWDFGSIDELRDWFRHN
jgi:predicted transposase YdaD